MPNEGDRKVIMGIIGAAVAVFIIVYIVSIALPQIFHLENNDGPIQGDPIQLLETISKDINVKYPDHGMIPVNDTKTPITLILPDISKYPILVESSTPSYIKIYSSPEKAGSGTDGWLTEVARDFNNARIMIDGQPVSVKLIGIPSGDAVDYITSGIPRNLPDAYTPSNELWGEMIRSRGVKVQLVQKRLAGNVAGILLTKAKKDELVNEYGAININTITDAVANGELTMGYTNPLASSTGLNFLISALETLDSSNSSDLLSDKAKAGFKSFQANIPVVAYTTMELRTNSDLDGLALEYQTYMNEPTLRSYEFIPFGFRHDSPMYAIGELSAEKRKILDKFVEFTEQEKYQTLATRYGFNGLNEYQSEARAVKGYEIIQAQDFWAKTKNPGKTICAVFVTDISGSMEGEPLNRLKRSLLEGQKYIGKDNMIGLVSYSNDVNVDLPIAKFNITQRAKFAGAVTDLRSYGNTATFDGIAIAMKMLIDQKAAGPNADPNLISRIFVLSDGNTNTGYLWDEKNRRMDEKFESIIRGIGIPIGTIGYNANIPELELISSKTESFCIDADNEDVVYRLRNLFNATLQIQGD